MPAQLYRLEHVHNELKAAGCCAPGLIYALFVLLCTLFFLADQDCRRCKYVLRTAYVCTPILCVTIRLWNIRDAATAVGRRRKCQNCSAFLLLFCIISLLLQLVFQLYALYQI